MIFYYASQSPIQLCQQIRPWSFASVAQQAITQVQPLVLGTSPQLAIDIGNGVQQLDTTVVIEVVFEHIRSTDFSNRLSRWQAAHLFENEADAVEFAMTYRQHQQRPYIYEISIQVTDGVFRADQILLNESPNYFADPLTEIDQMKDRAKKYWRGQFTRNPFLEILVPPGDTEVKRLMRILDK